MKSGAQSPDSDSCASCVQGEVRISPHRPVNRDRRLTLVVVDGLDRGLIERTEISIDSDFVSVPFIMTDG